ncbi:MAG: T9SS type A sorting domain-containing protein [candidate division Zixibacteria bacterium]|nr:T9SS type A sorting domain-containing protein [candidate division Zixibacteria bacterium]
MKRTITALMAIGLLLLLVPITAQGADCGDVDSDGVINISDMVYLLNYMFYNGPAPPDPSTANMDICGDIDLRDVAYLTAYLFQGGPLPCAGGVDCALYPQGSLSLDHVDGAVSPTQIAIERPVKFHIRVTNNTSDDASGILHGFRVYSPDGAQWSYTSIDTTGTLGFDQFDLAVFSYGINVDGAPADTVAFGGLTLTHSGLTSGFDDVAYTISLGSFEASDIGKTICIDSAFFPPAGRWVWSVEGQNAYSPPFGGPYCYTIVDEPDAEISLHTVGGGFGTDSIATGTPINFDLRVVNNTGSAVQGFTNGFRIYSPDGVDFGTVSGDTLGPIGRTQFDLDMGIPVLGDTVCFWGVVMTGPGIVDGFDDIPFRVSCGPIDASYAGGHVCIDSTFFPPSGPWQWAMNGGGTEYPAWAGPYCFTVAVPPYMLDMEPDTLQFTATEGVNPPMQTFNVWEVDDGSVWFEVSESVDWMSLNPTGMWTPNPVEVFIDVTGLTPGVYLHTITISSSEVGNSPLSLPVHLTVNEAGTETDSLIFPSVFVGQLCGAVQPVMVSLSQPIKGASIPIRLPAMVTADAINFDGLVTSDWDYMFAEINNDESFVHVALANTFGDMIPAGTTTVFNLVFNSGTAECLVGSHMRWDTTLMDNPSRQLLFADINNIDVNPGFSFWRDSTHVPGYMPGDIDGDGEVNIADLTRLVAFLFLYGTPPCVLNSADLNGTCTGPNIADLTYLVDYLFQSGSTPICGCLGGTQPPAKISSAISVNASFEDGATMLWLSSPVSLRGIQLELTGISQGPIENLMTGKLDMVSGWKDNCLSLGLVDLDGGEIISSGEQQLIRIPGQYVVTSAIVSDMNHQDIAIATVARLQGVPVSYGLLQNYPNPFNPTTTISFTLQKGSDYSLTIYNVSGQEVARFEGSAEASTTQNIVWDASDRATGIYFYRLSTDDKTETKKMTLLK